jgi:Acyl-CoA dehydrogenase N terminal
MPAPVDDALFLLNDVFHLDHYGNLPGFSDASPDWLVEVHGLHDRLDCLGRDRSA